MRTALRIWGEVKPYWRRLILTYVCLLAGLGLDLSIPYILRQAIDVGITGAQPRFMAVAGSVVEIRRACTVRTAAPGLRGSAMEGSLFF